MIGNIIFGFEICLPLFIIMSLGWYLKWRDILNEDFISRANHVVFYIALPAKLFFDMSKIDMSEIFNLKLVLIGVLGTGAVFLFSWIAGDIFIREPSKAGAFVHGSFRGNFVYIGLTLIQSILGKDTVACVPLIMATVIPLYNIFAVIVLTVKSKDHKKLQIGAILLGIIKNPMIIAIFAGLPFGAFHIPLPFPAAKALGYLGGLCTPLALLLIGCSIRFQSIKENQKIISSVCLIKLVFCPAVMTALAICSGLGSEEIVTLFVLFGVPSAANVYIMAKSMGGDEKLASGIVVMTTMLSMFTLAAGISILKTLGVV